MASGSCFGVAAVSASALGLTATPQASISAELAVYKRDDQSDVLPQKMWFCLLEQTICMYFTTKGEIWGGNWDIFTTPAAKLLWAARRLDECVA